MKTARNAQGELVAAGAEAPAAAFCPFCGGSVTLRRRQGADRQQATYFWRHDRITDPTCPERMFPARIQTFGRRTETSQ